MGYPLPDSFNPAVALPGALAAPVAPAVGVRLAPGFVLESGAVKFWSRAVIDPDGYRPNVGIILLADDGRVFWARRVNRDGWQFPQGGMNSDETPLEAMYRELEEETGLKPEHVEVLGSTPGWLRYRLPQRFLRRNERPLCIGQKQVWFLLRFVGAEEHFQLNAGEKPEFDRWCWVDFWYPMQHVVSFKRRVYERALRQFAPLVQATCQVPVMQMEVHSTTLTVLATVG